MLSGLFYAKNVNGTIMRDTYRRTGFRLFFELKVGNFIEIKKTALNQ